MTLALNLSMIDTKHNCLIFPIMAFTPLLLRPPLLAYALHWATPCAACLVLGECCCTFTLHIPFMTAVCAFYGVALHGPPLRIPEANATVREALAFFEESVGKSERYQSQGLLDVLYGVPYPNPEILASRLNLAYRLPSVANLNN
ncbi:hypothetical protein DFH07DRAFT_781546 [Mycena maculata]|uniref:Uncharacterized protein n=1 Tax=Mycena maculata TaxID=230809 RepID=A0AAD7HXE1_9AGAR|nr:hypothetical protein DFH07DRAFT_781546 [Mycena maculata]